MPENKAFPDNIIQVEEVSCPLETAETPAAYVSGRDYEYKTCANRFTFHRIADPEMVFLSPRPAIQELSTIYPKSYNAFNFHKKANPFLRQGRAYIQGRKARAIAGLIPGNGKVIDVGCGSGTLLMRLAELHGSHLELYANDFHKESLQHLEKFGIKLAVGRFEELDLPDASFDVVVMNQIIEHVDNPQGVLSKSARLLRPGGYLFIETPCLKGLDYALFRGGYWGGYHIPRHWTLFSERSLEQMAVKAGLEKRQVKFLASPSFWINSFYNMLYDKAPWLGAHRFFVIGNPLLLALFTAMDTILAKFRFTSNMRMVFQRPPGTP
jgi:ubiquinone/menaquinone biosynthesis C-methylase UbiE